jgi:alkylation response protein AidB-like acyl-CoA dehydrogenase
MDLDFDNDELGFRDEVRAFTSANLPTDIRNKVRFGQELEKDDYVRWQKILFDKGWLPVAWPAEYGGTGWSTTQQYIFEQECANAWAPALISFGLHMVGPVIYTYGTDEQKERFLPRIRSSDDWWCQGYSEPGSGSDLASLKTRAVDKGDHFVVNGQKTWTSFAQFSDQMFCLVKTDSTVKPQKGITFLLIDMKTPGITIQPIETIDKRHHVNEVFLDDVVVPKTDMIGEAGMGWTYAKFLLGHERMTIARVANSRNMIVKLKELARQQSCGSGNLFEKESFRQRIAAIELDLMALEYCELRVLFDDEGTGAEASMLKIQGSEIEQAITEMMVEALGYQALPYDQSAFDPGSNSLPASLALSDGILAELLFGRARTIFGGSNEIQKNIISRLMFDLS